jgi:hypothetical protein
LIVEFGIVFAIALVVTAIVSFLWNFIGHGESTIDWETAFRFALIFSMIMPWA